jgi:GNAT superfamily N-acetyltransferase
VRNLNARYTADVEATPWHDLLGLVVDGDDADIAGWEREVGVLMAHREPPPEPDARVTAVLPADLAALRREWLDTEVPRAEIVEQILLGDQRLVERTSTEALTIDGEAMTLRLGDGPVQMVEDVYTTPARRRQGLASALVRTAVANAYAAGAELVFLPTAHGGPAARLYARLGFRELCRFTGLWRV